VTLIIRAVEASLPWVDAPSGERHRPQRQPEVDYAVAIKGCDVSPGPTGCLTCPLSACYLDDPRPRLRWKRRVIYDRVTTGGESLSSVGFHSVKAWRSFLSVLAQDEKQVQQEHCELKGTEDYDDGETADDGS